MNRENREIKTVDVYCINTVTLEMQFGETEGTDDERDSNPPG